MRCRRRKRRRHPSEVRFAPDSPLEGSGFEPSVPRQEKWSMPISSDQTRVGRILTLGGGAEVSLEGGDIELSVSPKDIRTSPYDLCANRSDRRQSRKGDRWFESTSLQRGVRCEPDFRGECHRWPSGCPGSIGWNRINRLADPMAAKATHPAPLAKQALRRQTSSRTSGSAGDAHQRPGIPPPRGHIPKG
jgi:hypothetical protein